jgi:hypothetical protein
MTAYLGLPAAWRWSTPRLPLLDDWPRTTQTRDRIHGDPLNLAIVGHEDTLIKAMLTAGWCPADPITCTNCLRITIGTLFHRPYETAPVSNLYIWGRKQDLAFQQPVGKDPSKRHHVRFWRTQQMDDQGRPYWIGGGTFDVSVGFSHTTGQITHHISPEVDEERDKILADLLKAGCLEDTIWLDDFHTKRSGVNGGGDPYRTDGRIPVLVLLR